MKKTFLIAAVGLQVLVLVYMAWERESVVRNGQTVFLRTLPLDPRDPFRGDYVRLDYEMGRVSTNLVRGAEALTRAVGRPGRPTEWMQGRRVYTALRDGPGGVARLDYVSTVPPEHGLFVRGRTEHAYGGQVGIHYGIEAFFVQQTQGRVIEAGRRQGDVRVPLEMEVAVGRNGLAVLKGYRWCSVGMGLNFVTTTNRNRQIRSVTVKLVNMSSNTLAIVDVTGSRSMALTNDMFRSWNESEWSWVGSSASDADVRDEDVVVLAPGQSHEMQIDFERPEWFVGKPGEKPRTIGEVPWGAQFRLVYRAPSPETCRRLKQGALIWQGELVSQSFGGGRMD